MGGAKNTELGDAFGFFETLMNAPPFYFGGTSITIPGRSATIPLSPLLLAWKSFIAWALSP